MEASLSQDLLFLIHQFCCEEKLQKVAHLLEQETGFYFDVSYFEGLVLDGNWSKAEEYLSGFSGIHDNKYSTKIYFEMRKQKYFEALDRDDTKSAIEILIKDLKMFAPSNLEMYEELTSLLVMDDFRKHPLLSSHDDMASTRITLIMGLKPVIQKNPLLKEKMKAPQFEKARLKHLINHSLNWQHACCENPLREPKMTTLFTDHSCGNPSNVQIPPPLQSMPPLVSLFPGNFVLGESSMREPQMNTLFTGHSSVNPSSFQYPLPLRSLPPSVSPYPCNLVLGESSVPAEPSASAMTSEKGNSPNSESDVSLPAANLGNSSGQVVTLEGISNSGNAAKINSGLPLPQMDSLAIVPFQRQIMNSYDFPNAVERTMEMNSLPTSMAFHPLKDTFLLVGNKSGEMELWDISSEVKLFGSPFMIWKRDHISTLFLKDLERDPRISVNRVSWNPDGSLFGVAYSRHIVQLYSYHSMTNYAQKRLELDAHLGSVNDLAFSSPNDQLLLITCGDDKFVQVWDIMTGSKQFTFEGHRASVYSLSTHCKAETDFVFSTSTNGEIRAWLFDNSGQKVEYDAPGHCCMRMAYSADGKRLFSCGTNKEGESYIVEWDDTEGSMIRTYNGLCKSSRGVVQFCTSRNRFLAAGDDHVIKIWDVDNAELLGICDADGGLPARPYICINSTGTILAVFANCNKIKILANDAGRQLLKASRFSFVDFPGYFSEYLQKLGFNSTPSVTGRVEKENTVKEASMNAPVAFDMNRASLDTQKCSKIVEVSRCRALMVSSELKINKICRLTYTHSGNGILALAADGIHLLWRWLADGPIMFGRATTNYAPQLWQPKRGRLMINDFNNFKVVSPCFALSKNDSYVVSSSGKTVSLFNTMTLKKIRNCLMPPPTATCIGFYPPDNNVVAIGLEDSTILIYNARLGKVTNRLRGHVRRVCGLAFSDELRLLISSGVDNQIIVWSYNRWEKINSTWLQISNGWMPSETSETYVQFLKDEKHFLAVHETQLAVYEATNLVRVKQWIIGDFCTRILDATLSCDNQLIYAVMRNGIVLILSASDLTPRFEIDPSVYVSPHLSFHVRPLMVSAHPQKPNQIALGLNIGRVIVLEPAQPEGNWAEQPPAPHNGTSSAVRPVIVP